MRRVLDLCDIEEVAPMDATVEAAVEVLRSPPSEPSRARAAGSCRAARPPTRRCESAAASP